MRDGALMAHHNLNNTPSNMNEAPPFAPFGTPNQFSVVVCDAPDSPLTPQQCHALDWHLSTRFDLRTRDMAVRRNIWIVALEFCSYITTNVL